MLFAISSTAESKLLGAIPRVASTPQNGRRSDGRTAENGKVQEQGNHEQLCAIEGGYYASLVDASQMGKGYTGQSWRD